MPDDDFFNSIAAYIVWDDTQRLLKDNLSNPEKNTKKEIIVDKKEEYTLSDEDLIDKIKLN